VLNGLTRPFFGWVSDQIGREQTDVHRLRARSRRHHAPVHLRPESDRLRDPDRRRVLCLGRDLQPLPVDLRGHLRRKYAASNAGLLYTAKGTASLLVPLSSVLASATGRLACG
jgi:OFA family oxalate/formate antiporter-like MFS transporter